MAVMGKPVWAIVCGMVRREFELYTTLSLLLDYRKKKLIDGIVISTWKEEVDKIKNLRQKLKDFGIYLVELDMPNEIVGNYVEAGYLRQAYQLRSGLKVVPDDVFVLKARTDYSHDKIVDSLKILQDQVDLSLGKHGAMNFGLNYKIAVMRWSINRPWGLHDSGILGYKNDIRHLTDLFMHKFHYGYIIPVDFCWFINIFVNRYPVLDKILSLYKQYIFLNNLKNCKETNENFELPGILNKFYAYYFVILHNCFYLMNKNTTNTQCDMFGLLDVFQCKKEAGTYVDWLYSFQNPKAVESIVSGRVIMTKGYLKLYKEILRLAEDGYADNCTITKFDYDETVEWYRKVLNYNPSDWLNDYPSELMKNNEKNYSLEEAIDIFCEKNVSADPEFIYSLNYCLYGGDSWFYGRLANQLEIYKRIKSDLYDEILMTATRSQIDYIMLKVAKEAYYSEDTVYGNKITYVYRRFLDSEWWEFYYKNTCESITALYYYFKFLEKIGQIPPQYFYNQICRVCNKEKKSVQGNCIYQVLDIIKEAINTRYLEYEKNKLIEEFSKFWFLMMDFSELELEAQNFLSKYKSEYLANYEFRRGDNNAFENLFTKYLNAQNEVEKTVFAKKLLIEKYSQNASACIKVDEIIKSQLSKGLMKESILFDFAYFSDFTKISSIPNEEFTDALFWLATEGLLNVNKELILRQNLDSIQMFELELFLEIEKNKIIRYLSKESNNEYWLDCDINEILKLREESFIAIKDGQGVIWPFTKRVSSSPLALCLKRVNDKFDVKIQFSATESLLKNKILHGLAKNKELKNINYNARIVTLKCFTKKIENTYESALSTILNEFIQIIQLFKKAYEI